MVVENYWFNRRVTADDMLAQTIEVRDERLTVPAADILSEPLYCLRFNEDWKPHIVGAVNALQTFAAWIGTDDDSNDGTRQITKFLAQDMTDCGSGTPCTIEELLADDIFFQDTYIPQTFGDWYTDTNAHNVALNAAYDGTPQSIGADIPTGTPDVIEKNALCYAVNRFVELYSSGKLCIIQSKNFLEVAWNNLAAAANNFYDSAVSLMADIYTPNLYSCFVSDAAAITALQDAAAIEELACFIFDELSGVTISQSNFDNAILSAATTLAGNAAAIACLMQNDSNLTLYINFLEGYNIAINRAHSGENLECPCEPATTYWMLYHDFSVSKNGWTNLLTNGDYCEYLAGLGWRSRTGLAAPYQPLAHVTVRYDLWTQAWVIKGIVSELRWFDPEPSGAQDFSLQTFFAGINFTGTQANVNNIAPIAINIENAQIGAPTPTNTTPLRSIRLTYQAAGGFANGTTRDILLKRLVIWGLPDGLGNKPDGSVWAGNTLPTTKAGMFP